VVIVRTGWDLPDAELSWRFSRSSGPGGQHVNTTDSRATVSFDVAASASLAAAPPVWRTRALARLPPVVTVTASEQRSQLQNREAAVRRLAQRLREATDPPPPPRRPTRPSRGSVERRIAAKKRRAVVKRGRRAEEG